MIQPTERKMFCFQCEQTAGCSGCIGQVGVCGKTADIARLQDKLTGALIGLARASEGNEALITDSTNQLIIEGLFSTLTNVCFDKRRLSVLIKKTEAEKRRMIPNCFSCLASCACLSGIEKISTPKGKLWNCIAKSAKGICTYSGSDSFYNQLSDASKIQL